MAQVAEGDIKAGLSRIVGHVRVDPGMIRAEAGPLEPRLVVPVSVEMSNQPADRMLALTRLRGVLHLDDPNNASTQIGMPASVDLVPGMHVRSLPNGRSVHGVELRFNLSLASVYRLEFGRHEVEAGDFTIYLRLEAPLVWVRQTWGEARPSGGRAGNTVGDDPFQMQFGLHSEFSYFWTSEIDRLRVQIDQSVWINKVLPGFGIDNIRLVEVTLPPGLPDIGNAAKIFDDAHRAFNAKRYEDCIGKCRGIIRAWNKQLGASNKQHLAELVADTQRWPTDDPRREVLDSIWQALLGAGNVANHPEGQDALYEPTAHDARLHLMMTAIVSEYLHRVLP
jgi:hypothetical protein